MKLAVIGAGAMGTHHARVVASTPGASLEIVVDASRTAGEGLATDHGCAFSTSTEEVAGCAGAVVATPTATHLKIALELLDLGIPILVEKPLATETEEVNLILETARKKSVALMCGFVERFNPAFTSALELLQERPRHVVFIRHSPKAPRAQGDVIADVAIHDLDLAMKLVGPGISVRGAAGWKPSSSTTLEMVDCTLQGQDGSIVTMSANRWSQTKKRLLTISTDSETVEVDLMRQSITVYRHISHDIVEGSYRAETAVDIPFIRHAGEPLALQLQHFMRLIEGEADVDGERESILPPHQLMDSIRQRTSATEG